MEEQDNIFDRIITLFLNYFDIKIEHEDEDKEEEEFECSCDECDDYEGHCRCNEIN